MFSVWVGVPTFHHQYPFTKDIGHAAISILGRENQKDPWNSMTNQLATPGPNDRSHLRTKATNKTIKRKADGSWGQSLTYAYMIRHIHICTYACIPSNTKIMKEEIMENMAYLAISFQEGIQLMFFTLLFILLLKITFHFICRPQFPFPPLLPSLLFSFPSFINSSERVKPSLRCWQCLAY